MKKLLCALFLFFTAGIAKAEEITLFNADGEPIAYIDAADTDLPIYMWDGTPVAYLFATDKDYFHIYGFNGKHLGWFENGLVIDHKGYRVGFQEGAVSKYTKYEPYKSYKKYKPYKAYRSYPPYKPYTQIRFSYNSLSLFLMAGKKD